MGDIYFNGAALASEKKVKFNGTDMSNVYFNGTKIWTYYSETPQAFTSSGTYVLDAAETSVQYKLSGGGGGGGGASGYTGATAGGVGGDTVLKVLAADGSVRQTIATASGGAAGPQGGGNRTGASDFSIPSGWANPPWSSTVSDGGLGAQGQTDNPSGTGGAAGSTATGTYTINADGNDHTLQITIGGGGANGGAGEAGQYAQSGNSGGAWLLYIIS
jgi:hypothetical protein